VPAVSASGLASSGAGLFSFLANILMCKKSVSRITDLRIKRTPATKNQQEQDLLKLPECV
jgi:hypothetical protein